MLFDYNINVHTDSSNRTLLPYSVFGMTQEGIGHRSQSIGNQDSGSIYIGKKLIIASLADGCTSGDNLNGISSNQVGAHVMTYLAIRVARQLILKKRLNIDELLEPFQDTLFYHLKRLYNSFNPWKKESLFIIRNFLSSTFCVLIIFNERYIVLNSGDGDVFINGVKLNMGDFNGKYFGNNLLTLPRTPSSDTSVNMAYPVTCVAKGKAKELKNVLISTDGFVDNDIEANRNFKKFFFPESIPLHHQGFMDIRRQFRAELLEDILLHKNGKTWPIDDATFISLQRLIK